MLPQPGWRKPPARTSVRRIKERLNAAPCTNSRFRMLFRPRTQFSRDLIAPSGVFWFSGW